MSEATATTMATSNARDNDNNNPESFLAKKEPFSSRAHFVLAPSIQGGTKVTDGLKRAITLAHV